MDRLKEIKVFAAVVDQGGFTDAAKKMKISKSTVSKMVTALEARLGARLLNRTTRRVSPTEIGLAYYDRTRRILSDVGEADDLVTSTQSVPQGQLRLAANTDFGVSQLMTIMPGFLSEYPGITVDLVLRSRCVEIVSEGFDVAIQLGDPRDSSLRTHEVAQATNLLVGSPSYFQKWGRPQSIEDLSRHKLLHLSHKAAEHVWKFRTATGEVREVRGSGQLTINDSQSLLAAAISGLGIARLPSFVCREAIKDGRVEEVTLALPEEQLGIYLAYPSGGFTQPKVQALIDFLGTHYKHTGIDAWQ